MSRLFAGVAGDHLDASYTLGGTLPITVSAWVKLTANLASQRLVDIGSTSTNRLSLTIGNTDLVAAHHNDGTLSAAITAATTPSDLGWHVWTGTFVANNSRAVFVDGVNKATNSGTRTGITVTSIRVGQDLAGANRLTGYVAHMAVWNGTLSDSDVALLATVSPNMVRPDILYDYWPLTSNNASEPSYGSQGTVLTATGTTFSADNPNLNQGLIQPMFHQRKLIYVDQR